MPTTQCSPSRCRERLAEYAALYGDVFGRTDQRVWFRLYLQGLLTAPDRKNIEGIAAAVSSELQTDANLGQALHHFVAQSPWDPARVMVRYRELLDPRFREAARWIVHDGVLLKKGRNSVGTQRQMARSIRRKVNCQVAVIVGISGPAGYVPLAARLYLPGYWLRENAGLVTRTVPIHLRGHIPKTALAITLLDELRAEGWTAPAVVLDEAYGSSADVAEGLASRGIEVEREPGEALVVANERFDRLRTRLGLDHFEGRTWMGWHHHAALVFAAAGFLEANNVTK